MARGGLAVGFGLALALALGDGSRADELKVVASPATAMRDEPFSVSVEGASPGAQVEVEAVQLDAAGKPWRAAVRVRADASGRAKVADPARLISGMTPPAGDNQPFDLPPYPTAMRVQIKARSDAASAETTLVRLQAAPDVAAREVRESGLVGELFMPTDGRPHRALIVLGGSEGGYGRSLPALFASHGFAVLSLAYFGAPGLPKSLVDVPIEPVPQAMRWLAAQPGVAPGGVYLFGISRGGELAMLAGIASPLTRGVIGLVPDPIIFAGLQFGKGPVDASPWVLGGKPVPYITFRDWTMFERTHDARLIERAFVPLERLKAPLLLVTGDDDKLALSSEVARLAIERLNRLKPGAAVEWAHYPDCGHMIYMPLLPTANLDKANTPYGELEFGGTAEGYAEADRDAWARILAFMSR